MPEFMGVWVCLKKTNKTLTNEAGEKEGRMSVKTYKYYDIVREQIKNHPTLTGQDLMKFCYQGCYGPKHLITDKERAYSYFLEEYDGVTPKEGMLTERISEDYIRINFAPYKKAGLPPEWLFEMFYYTATDEGAVTTTLEDACLVVEEVLQDSEGCISVEEWKETVRAYDKQDCAPIHHSAEYKAAEDPHYRIISDRYEGILPIFLMMKEKQDEEKKAVRYEYQEDYAGEMVAVPVERKNIEVLVLAIEGRAASGKTTLSAELERITKYPVIKMDHFFLPKSLQKTKRLQEPGGNIHYERFLEEVVSNIKEEQPFTYAIYDCMVGGKNGVETVPSATWRIVEGVYSLHPKFGDYADLKVFVDVGPDEQMLRIRQRNGVKMAKMFRETWIPMEEVYFHKYKHEKNADYIYEGYKRPY